MLRPKGEMSIRIYNAGEATVYYLLEEVRPGGMEGRTWRAQQVGPDGRALDVAVKVLTRDSWLGREVDPTEMLRRWRGQMQVMRSFGHRGFAPVQVAFPISAPPDDSTAIPDWMLGAPAFVMTWIDGVSLDEWSAGVADPLRRLQVLEICANGLDEFHRVTGHVHRDLKPANIMVEHEVARIVDYGLIRSLDHLRGQSTLAGTRAYMDPALLEGGEYSAATDLFSFAGIILHQLTLTHPIPGRLAPEIQGDLMRAELDRVAALIAYSLSPKPVNRPEVDGAADLLDRVISLMRPSPVRVTRSPRRAPSIAGVSPSDASTRSLIRPSPEPAGDLSRLVVSRILTPAFVAGFLTVLIVLLVRLLTN